MERCPWHQTLTFQVAGSLPHSCRYHSRRLKADRQSFQASQKRSLDPGWFAGEGDRVGTCPHFAEEDYNLYLSEIHPDASVDTEAEADMAVWSSIGNE